MAERRMFAKTIIDSDAFLDMPVTARLLYYDLSMRADDDGFVNSPKKIMRMVGASQDDLSILILRKFILPFENGIVVIKHWRIHNYIRKDTYNETPYLEEKSMLEIDQNKAYKFKDEYNNVVAVDGSSTQVSIGKDSIDKVRLNNNYIVDSFSKEFEELWKKYPRKDGKKDAFRHYQAARRDGVTYKTISDGLDRYNNYIEKAEVNDRYIKGGSSWFCGRHWDDEYKIPKKQLKPGEIDWDNV